MRTKEEAWFLGEMEELLGALLDRDGPRTHATLDRRTRSPDDPEGARHDPPLR